MKLDLSATIVDMELGYEIILNEEDAKELGVGARERVNVSKNGKSIVAIVSIAKKSIKKGEIGVTPKVAEKCNIKDNDVVEVSPALRPISVDYIKKKLDGLALTEEEYREIVKDVVSNNLSEIELTAFVTALYIHGISIDEAVYLTKSMVESGERLNLKKKPVFDKHSIGGVPGNKITLLIVPIVAAAGLTIPKTSSRAITNAAGTADIMEVLAPVTFTADEIEEIVNKTNGIIAWGGGVNLAPADDVFIRVEYPLAIDPRALTLCSVMAKKLAVGANYVAIDMPVGSEAKVTSIKEAKEFARDFITLGEKLGITVECAITYGEKPIGRAIGPALEAKEALSTLENGRGPGSFVEKATDIAGMILEAGRVARRGSGKEVALEYLKSGKALEKMREIIEAQGGDPKIKSNDIQLGEYREKIVAQNRGYVTRISNKALIKIARTAGSPKDKGAGILMHVTKGEKVKEGEVLFEIFAEKSYKLEAAVKLAYQLNPISIEGMTLARIPEYSLFYY